MDKEQMEAARASEAALKAAHSAQEANVKALEESGSISDVLASELASELASLDGKPSVTPAPAVAVEKKADHTPSDALKAPAETPKPEEVKKEQPPESTPVQDDQASKRSRDRWAKQLHEKNEAKRQAEDLEKQNAELRKKLEEAELREVDEIDEPDVKDVAPKPTEDMREVARQVLREERAAEESHNSEFDELYKDMPEAKGHRDDIEDVMLRHPTLSPLGAYRLLNPAAFAVSPSGQGHEGKMDAGSRMDPSKLNSKAPYQMTDAELDEAVEAEVMAGAI